MAGRLQASGSTPRRQVTAPVQIGKLMNKNVAEAARRVFGHLPYSKVRSGNKALRKNIIGRKIAEYYPQSTAPDMVKMAEREIPGVVMDLKRDWRQQKRDLDEGTERAPETRHGAEGHVLVEMNGGFRALQLKEANGVPTMDRQSLIEVRQHVEWWDENFMVNVAVLSGDGEHFCSGLDLATLRGHPEKVKATLKALCNVVTALDASETPTVSVLDGSCIGSGYALCMGRYRFATENSIFHVPEATLGLGLAGGLSYTLPRLLGGNQPLALCLALTGMALEGPDLLFTQIATNYMTHRKLEMMMERLAEINQDPKPFGNKTPDCSEDPTAVQTLLERSGELSWNIDGLPDDCLDPTDSQVPITSFVHEVLPQVEQVFAVDSVEGAIDNLRARREPWAQMALQNIERSSPLSLKVIFEQVKRGGGMSLHESLDDEFSVNTHLFGLPDFEMAMQAREEGERTPAWKCGSMENISPDQVAAVFEKVPRSK
eukprot:g11123.t1